MAEPQREFLDTCTACGEEDKSALINPCSVCGKGVCYSCLWRDENHYYCQACAPAGVEKYRGLTEWLYPASATPLHGESDISGDRAEVAQEKEQ